VFPEPGVALTVGVRVGVRLGVGVFGVTGVADVSITSSGRFELASRLLKFMTVLLVVVNARS
jgi:hypothetical protein